MGISANTIHVWISKITDIIANITFRILPTWKLPVLVTFVPIFFALLPMYLLRKFMIFLDEKVYGAGSDTWAWHTRIYLRLAFGFSYEKARRHLWDTFSLPRVKWLEG